MYQGRQGMNLPKRNGNADENLNILEPGLIPFPGRHIFPRFHPGLKKSQFHP
jgi:hypothetical protein